MTQKAPSMWREKRVLWTCGWLLSFWSGSINMIASYAIIFTRVSHMTGPASDLSRFILLDASMALYVVLIVVSFVLGAYLSALVAKRVKFSVNLTLSTLPAVVTMTLLFTPHASFSMLGTHLFAVLLPMGMGWQNGATSQSEIGRTTHVTGDMTDLGLRLAQGDYAKSFYFAMKFLSFVLGGIAGLTMMNQSPRMGLAFSVLGVVFIGILVGAFETKKRPLSTPNPNPILIQPVDMQKVSANS